MLIGRFSARQFRYNLLPVSSRHGSVLRDLDSQVKLKHEQQCFIGFKTTRRSQVVLDQVKHVLRAFWMASKKFLEKRVCQESS